MDNWNRNNQDAYTGITAQRRNRRRTAGQPEPVKTGEPADRTAYMRPEEPAETEDFTEAVKPEEPEEVLPPAEEPEEPAAPEELPVVKQDADSRVPAEARRMAAAPYGEGGAAARRETRRDAALSSNRVVIHPRGPQFGGDESAAPGRMPEQRQEQRVRVGYAPGRMSGDMTQPLPSRDSMRETYYTEEAKAYLEKRKHPFRAENDAAQVPDKPGHKALRTVAALLILAGFVLTGWMIMKNRGKETPEITREAPQVISFEAHETGSLIAPADLSFSVVTGKDVEGIRLRADGDRDLDTVASCGDNADSKDWMMKMHVETGFQGRVMLQVRRGMEEGWYDTGFTADVDVSSPILPEGQETGSPVPANPDTGMTSPPEDGTDREPGEEPEGETPEDGEAGEAEPEEELPAGELKTPAPTATPAPATPEPTVTPPLTAEADPEADPGLITNTTVWTSFTKKEKSYSRLSKELIQMPAADEYTTRKIGVTTFRGDNFRRNAAVGTLSAAPLSLEERWKVESGSARGTSQTYYGYGWTGQAAIARWSTEVRAHSNITEAKIEVESLKEVIIAGLDGNIRFLDLNDGAITRNSIKLGYPMRGTPTLHSRGYPFMTVGQSVRKMKTKTGKIGLRQYNLFTQKELKLIDGLDGKYHRPLNDIGSFDTSALVDWTSDTVIAVGTNGMLYLEALNPTFDYNTGILTVTPSITAMTSKVKGRKNAALLAVESSPAAYDKYVFYADMGGVLRCVDTNTLTPVWAVSTGDSVMAAVAMDLTRTRELNLYTANMLNNRKKGNVQIRRYNALSGKETWCTEIGVAKGKKEKYDVGAKASPVIGQNNLDKLVYFTVTGLSAEGRAELGLGGDEAAALIALEKDTGKIAWTFGLSSRSESSPVALYDKEGNGWIFQCEQNGMIHLLDGLDGREVCNMKLEAEIEASPAAYNNVVVIGTTGKNTSYVYAIEVKLDKPEEEKGGTGNE